MEQAHTFVLSHTDEFSVRIQIPGIAAEERAFRHELRLGWRFLSGGIQDAFVSREISQEQSDGAPK